MESAGEKHPRARKEAVLDGAGSRAELLGIDSAGGSHDPLWRDAQGEPLLFDLGRNRGETGVREDRTLERGGAAGSGELFGLAKIAGDLRVARA